MSTSRNSRISSRTSRNSSPSLNKVNNDTYRLIINRLLMNLNINLNEVANNAVTQKVSYWTGVSKQAPLAKQAANDVINKSLKQLSTYKQLSKRSKVLANSSIFTRNLTEHQEYLKLLKQYRNKILEVKQVPKNKLNTGVKKLKELDNIENKITAVKFMNKRKPPIELIRKDLHNTTGAIYRHYINQIPHPKLMQFMNQRYLH